MFVRGGGVYNDFEGSYCVFVYDERQRERCGERREGEECTVEGNLNYVFPHLAVLEKARSG